jgi:hypothetical protein
MESLHVPPFSLAQIVCEVRYSRGSRYFDTTGDLIASIEGREKGWQAANINISSSTLANPGLRMNFNFGPKNAALVQSGERSDVGVAAGEPFVEHCKITFDSAFERFKPATFDRIGIRFNDLKKVASAQDGLALMEKSPIFSGSRKAFELLGKKPTGRNAVYRVEENNAGIVLRVGPFTRKGMEYSEDLSSEEVAEALGSTPEKGATAKRAKEIDLPNLAIVVDIDVYWSKLGKSIDVATKVKQAMAERARLLKALSI